MPRRHSFYWVSVFLVLSAVVAFGQRDLGTITGTVTDAQGAAIPNAKVSITDDSTGVVHQNQTNEAGAYTVPALNPSTYTVKVEAAGFQAAQQKGLIVNPGQPTSVDIKLQVGNATQTVEVTAAAPLLQTESPIIGANLNSTQVADLPLGGQRNFTFLARLSPGVLPAENGSRDALGGGFSANGVRSSGENNFLLNGVDNNVNVIDFINQTAYVIGPSVEAIGQMQIITNGNNAEYGRAAGGVIDVNLKSGTNDLHGVLFEILQNTVLNANRWENNLAGQPRNPFKQNQFGLAMGGPIVKNKLFIFGDYQGTRLATAGGSVQNLGYGGFYTIATPAMVKGDFSSLLGPGGPGIQLYDPRSTICTSGCLANSLTGAPGATPIYSRTPYNNNQIPVTEMDPAALKIASLYPAPNQPIATGTFPQNDYYTATPGSLTTDQGDGRVDYHLSDKDSLFGSVSWSNTSKTSVPPFQGILDGGTFNGSAETDLGRNAQLGWTHIISPTIVSESRVGFTRLVTSRTQANATTDAYAEAGIGGYNPTGTASNNGGIPQISFFSASGNINTVSGNARYTQIGANDWLPTKEYSNVWDFIENLSVTKGNHSMKFGAEFRPIHFPFFQVPYPHGEMNFNQNETAFPSTVNSLNSATGDPMASFLLGAVDAGQISTTNGVSSTKKAFAFYAQDDWKVTQKLTLNLGVRYEIFSPIGEQFSRQSNFNPDNLTLYIPAGPNQNAPLPPNFNQPASINGVQFPALFTTPITVSRGQVGPYLIPWDKADIGPRVGFAYNIFPKTVIRAAYGIFYGGEENQGGSPNRGESAPFNLSPQLNRVAGVSLFQPNPLFANGQATGGVSIGYPTNIFTGFPVSSLQFRSLASNFLNPMVQKWNFAIQQELPGQMALEVGYIGNHSSHQLIEPDLNPAANIGTTDTSITQASQRRYPDIGNISGTTSFGYGNYNALTAKLEKRLSNGLQFVSAYTYGHALANSNTPLSGSQNWTVIDPTNYGSSYSNASWDIRHNFTTGFNYDIPFGRGKQYGANLNKFVQTALGNWQMNGIVSFRSGQPYTIIANGCQGVWNVCRPDLVEGANPDEAPSGGRNPSHWFNTANMTGPAPLTGGNLGIQSNYAPPTRNVDLSIFKSFAFTERFALQFRAESFNIANTSQFFTPDANYNDSKFGQVTSTATGSERHIQFALRLQF